MPLTITHNVGPLANTGVVTFADEKSRVVVGRDPALCDIVYPPDLTVVGREHCALVRQISGDYVLENYGEHYVEMDGVPAESGAPIHSGARLAFGQHDGPSLTVAVDRSAVSSALSRTVAQKRVPAARVAAGRARALAVIGLGVALAVAGAVAWQWRSAAADREQRATLETELSTLVAAQKAEANERISRADRERLAESVYAVTLRDTQGREGVLGTAWPVSSNLLATNAHIAKDFEALKEGEALLVRPGGAGKVGFVVDGVAIHPGYDAFASFANNDVLFTTNYGGMKKVQVDPGYDVALLKVSGPIPPTKILTIAESSRLEALAPGEPLAYAGFPYESLRGDPLQPLGRTPQVQVGNITGLTDYFFLPAIPGQRRFVQHNLPGAGGASGSPLIDSQGKVVALLNGGNVVIVDGQRTPSAAQINFAQRADVLRDLLESRAADKVKDDMAYWRQRLALFQKGADLVIAELLDAERPRRDSKADLLVHKDAAMTAQNRCMRTGADNNKVAVRCLFFPISAPAGSRHTVVAYAMGGQAIGAVDLLVAGKMLRTIDGGDVRGVALSFDMPSSGAVSIAVETADEDITFRLDDYVWRGSSS